MSERSALAVLRSTYLLACVLPGGYALPAAAATGAGLHPSATPICRQATPTGALQVDAICADPIYNSDNFVVDGVTTGVVPQPYTKVTGHYGATATTPRFDVSLYLPAADKWQGRFFQHVYPLEEPENVEHIAFALGNGGYYVKVKGVPCGCGGYRPEAAAAKWAKDYARAFYESGRRIYGYIWGGSGGGILSVGAIENTTGVWDGGVPYVLPAYGSMINVNAMNALANEALTGSYPAINAALKPGANGDPEATLTPEQRAIFRESLAFGVPLRSYESATGGGYILMFLSDGVRKEDPTYVRDFWSKPGYEGTHPPDFLKRAKVDEILRVTKVERDARGIVTRVTFDHAPTLGSLGPLGLDYSLLGPDGGMITRLNGTAAGDSFILSNGADAALAEGARVRADNLFYLAMTFYHRHTVPPRADMYTYDQYRNADGTPRLPQRDYLGSVAQTLSAGGGGTQTGSIHMKVILNQNLLDTGALAWQGDWYAAQVRKALGGAAYANSFRLYYNDNAEHFDIHPDGGNFSRVIWYVPALHQSLLDMVAWVELGVPPPASTSYRIEDGQVVLPATATLRHGIQPVVSLSVGSGDSIEVAAGQPVSLAAHAAAPPGTGRITRTSWWFGRDGASLSWTPIDHPLAAIDLRRTYTWSKPGTYYVTFAAASQRNGDAADRLTAIENLARVRVVVH